MGKIQKLSLRFELMIETIKTFRKYLIYLLSANSFTENVRQEC